MAEVVAEADELGDEWVDEVSPVGDLPLELSRGAGGLAVEDAGVVAEVGGEFEQVVNKGSEYFVEDFPRGPLLLLRFQPQLALLPRRLLPRTRHLPNVAVYFGNGVGPPRLLAACGLQPLLALLQRLLHFPPQLAQLDLPPGHIVDEAVDECTFFCYEADAGSLVGLPELLQQYLSSCRRNLKLRPRASAALAFLLLYMLMKASFMSFL